MRLVKKQPYFRAIHKFVGRLGATDLLSDAQSRMGVDLLSSDGNWNLEPGEKLTDEADEASAQDSVELSIPDGVNTPSPLLIGARTVPLDTAHKYLAALQKHQALAALIFATALLGVGVAVAYTAGKK